MKLSKLPEILLALNFIVLQIVIDPVASSLSYENKNIVKIKQDPTRFQQASAFRNKKNNVFATRLSNRTTPRENNNINLFITSRHSPLAVSKNYSQDKTTIGDISAQVPRGNQYKKWQVGRVSRKQYEIINMLWRKTKIFVDMESSTAKYNLRRSNETVRLIDSLSPLHQHFPRLPSRPNFPATTPSYIEFYYLDEADERVKELTTQKQIQVPKHIREHQLRNLGNFKFVLVDSPMFAFRINDPNYKRSAMPTRYMQPTNRMKRRKTRTRDSSMTGFDALNSITPSYKFPQKRTQQITFSSTKNTTNIPKNNTTLNVSSSPSIIEFIDNETCPYTTQTLTLLNYTTEINDKTEIENKTNETTYTINITHTTGSTTAYDKIKFFEIYDKQTPVPYYDEKGRLIDMNNVEIYVKGHELNNERQILLEHVDQSFGNEHSQPHKAKHAKKHIVDNYVGEPKTISNNKSVIVTKVIKNLWTNISKIVNVTKQPEMKLLLPKYKVTNTLEYKKSKHVEWFRYPFAAAYVYEPSQVHCDAAGISPHWLITSGACLSRHHKNPGGQGRSAFVTYCGESWWNPERVAYVKYSLVHPRFHPRDKTRRHLYNIGLIQVVTSMASACTGWSSISLMSHQFVTEQEGSIANAIGWGLDRFDTRYSSNDLPKSLLMSYENQVYSDSCPGNVGYSKAKRLDEEGGIKNVYCLSLPPYSGEETDPIHGGLLLVGGKLVALYLQEERRPWGDQCAQYTGTWRLVPWVLDVARENDETDAFTLEI